MSNAVRRTLKALAELSDNAVALVSGRELADVDRIIAPLDIAAAGSHGAEIRFEPGGSVSRATWTPDEWLLDVIRELQDASPALIVEYKPASVAVHFRGDPAAEPTVRGRLQQAVETLGPEFELMAGKMVFELRRTDCHKGQAIRRMSGAPAFAHRTPVFIGDDVTDEDAFAAVNAMGGTSIKVGDMSSSSAEFALSGVAQVHAWLASLL